MSAPPAAARAVVAPDPRRSRLAVASVVLAAFLVRLPALGRPAVLVFDEVFYAPDAADLIRYGAEHGQPAHPALGKWLIATGIRTFGFTPVGWRIASVVAGALLCGLVAWAAIGLTRRVAGGLAAGALVGLDGIVHVTSRLALLDVFLALFTTATLVALLAAWWAQPDRSRARRWWWVAVASLALGTAVKWSALSSVPLVLAVGWVLAGRLEAPGRPRRRVRALTVLAVAVLPLLAVVGSVLPRQLGPDRTTPAAYLDEQVRVARYHRDLRPVNPNSASGWTWATLAHPAVLYRSRCPLASRSDRPGTTGVACAGTRETVARVVAGGNPAVWLCGLVGFAAVLAAAIRRRDEVAALLAAGVASVWLPWLLSPRRAYSFYAVAVVPALVLAASWAAATLPGRVRRPVTAGAVGAAALAFAVLWPAWSAQPFSPGVDRWLTAWPGWS